jgi:hypothetical protein
MLRYPHLQEILIIPRTCAAVKTALVKDEDFLIAWLDVTIIESSFPGGVIPWIN